MNADTSQTRTMKLIGRGKRVLEFGCAAGYVSRILSQEFDCTVTGIEQNPGAAEEARRACQRVRGCWRRRGPGLRQGVPGAKFDVVLFSRLTGCVVASIPNIAHAAVAADLQECAALQHRLSRTETRAGWAKLGVRLFLGPHGYETVKWLYSRARGLRARAETTGGGRCGRGLVRVGSPRLEDVDRELTQEEQQVVGAGVFFETVRDPSAT